jgi:hypothetical protein
VILRATEAEKRRDAASFIAEYPAFWQSVGAAEN